MLGSIRSARTFSTMLALAVAAPMLLGAAHDTELITNGSFEEPDIPTHSWSVFGSIPGWSISAGSPGNGIEIQDHVAGNPAPGAGGQFVELDAYQATWMHQDILTVPGNVYRLTYLWSPRPGMGAADNHFRVTAGSATAEVGPAAGLGGGVTDWRAGELTFTATATSSPIQFADLGPSNGGGAYIDLVSVKQVNRAPDCSATAPSTSLLWSPNHEMRAITIGGATDPDGDPTSVTIDGVTQDEAVNGVGDGSTAPDAELLANGGVALRAERAGVGDGRVYVISFTVNDDGGGSCTGTATVTVPHSRKVAAVDSGQTHDSFAA